jgi:hypothetical protein
MRFDRRLRDGLLCGLVLCQLAYSWMYSRVSVPNERTRAYLSIAIVDHASIAVDAPVARFGKVYDLARFGDHFFTDKAPGASFLAVPVYALARWSRPAGAFDVVDVVNLLRTYLMLPVGLLAFIALRSLLRALGRSEPVVDVCSLGFSLGSAMLHYAGAFYGHAIVALLVLACLRCLVQTGVFAAEPARSSPRRAWLLSAAGACVGLAGLTEYQAIVLAALLSLPLLLSQKPARARVRDFGWFALGGLPFALGLLIYDQRAFGAAFSLSYEHLVGTGLRALHSEGLMGATWPRWSAFTGLLLSQHRGLLATSPLLGLGLFGLASGPRGMPRSLWLTLTLCVAYFVLIVASSSVWFGGWSFGPRLLLPIMGPLAVAAAYAMDSWRANPFAQLLFRAAAISGMLYQQAVHAVFPELPPEFARPLPDAVSALWQARLFAPNLACKWSPLGASNIALLAALLGCSVALVAFRGLSGRTGVACGALLAAATALLMLAAAPASVDARERQEWLQRVQRWQAQETRCRGL